MSVVYHYKFSHKVGSKGFYKHFKIFSIISNILPHFLNILIDENVFSLKNLIKPVILLCG